MQKIKVYISSTFRDLQGFRKLLIDFFEKEGQHHFELVEIMEHMYDKGDNKPQLKQCLEEVEKCSVYLIILGKSAGSFPTDESEETYTLSEYKKAVECQKTIFRFWQNDVKKANFLTRLFRLFSLQKENKKSIECLNELKKQFQDLNVHHFSDSNEFKAQYMQSLFQLINPNTENKKSPNKILSKINRNFQTNLFNIEVVRDKRVFFFHYQSEEDDFPHLLNFRLSNVEVNSEGLQFESESFISPNKEELSFLFEDYQCMEMLVQKIRRKLDLKIAVNTIEMLIDDISKKKSDYIFIPFRIEHSLETIGEESRLSFLSKFFDMFQTDTVQSNLKNKKIIFLINFQKPKSSSEIDEATLELIYQQMNQLSKRNYLGNLKEIVRDDLKKWILNEITAIPNDADAIINQNFDNNFPKKMSLIVSELNKSKYIMKRISEQN